MKKALLTVLFVVLVIAVFVLAYKLRKRSHVFVGKSGATHQRHDHNGKTVNTQECENLVGKNNDLCLIPISYLQSMKPDSPSDIAIEVHHKETIVWYGDKGETITVQQMAAVDCSKHDQPDNPPYGSDPFLVDITKVSPNLTYAHITDNSKNDNYCYETNIDVTVNGKTIPIDPHTFDQPDTP